MKVQNYITLSVLSNLAFFTTMVVFLFITRNENWSYDDHILILLFREGIILIIQAGWNLLLKAIPVFYPTPQNKEPK